MSAQETINLITAGLGLGLKAYESARRIEAAGYTVPNLLEFEKRIIELNKVPRKTKLPSGNGGSSAPLPVGHA